MKRYSNKIRDSNMRELKAISSNNKCIKVKTQDSRSPIVDPSKTSEKEHLSDTVPKTDVYFVPFLGRI